MRSDCAPAWAVVGDMQWVELVQFGLEVLNFHRRPAGPLADGRELPGGSGALRRYL